MLSYLTNEIKYLGLTQSEILKTVENINDKSHHSSNSDEFNSVLNDMTDCQLPINNIIDLNTFEDKISGDKSFRNNLVIIKF